MAIITAKIGAARTAGGANGAGEYTTIDLWWASLPADIIASGNSYVGEMYNDGVFGRANLAGNKNAGPDNTVTLKAATGHSWRDHATVRNNRFAFDQSKGVAILFTGSYDAALNIETAYVKVSGIQIKSTGNPGYAVNSNNVAYYCTLENCSIYSGSHAAGHVIITRAIADLINCLIVQSQNTGGSAIQMYQGRAINNTIVMPSDLGIGGTGLYAEYAPFEAINNAIFGFATAMYGAAGTSGHNVSDSTNCTGTNNLLGQTYANQFEQSSAASAVEDFRLKAGATAIDAGVAHAATPVDATGVTRPKGAGYDAGAWEYMGAVVVVPPAAPVIGTATPSNGSASVTFGAPASDGNGVITSYTATSTPGGLTATGSGSPLNVTGLTNNTAYTFKVKATNSAGTGAESAASNSVTPYAPASVSIASQPVPDGQSQRFVLATANAIDGTITLTAAGNGAVTQAPYHFDVVANAADVTIPGIPAGDYTVSIRVNGVGDSMTIAGNPFSILGAGGGGSIPETPASAVTLSGPANGTNGTVSTNFTVSVDGALTGNVVITPTDSGQGGTFNPATITLTADIGAGTFTYTPASTGVKNIGVSNNGSLANPPAIAYTVAAPVDVTNPTVTLASNVSTVAVNSSFTLTATATDNVGVDHVQFLLDGVVVSDDTASPFTFTRAVTAADNGTLAYTAKAYDAAGNNVVSNTVVVTVNIAVSDSIAPTVTLASSSTNMTADGSFTLTATASDDVAVDHVEFWLGGALVYTDGAAPFTYVKTVTAADNGSLAYTAKAFDAAGNMGASNTVSVVVNIASVPSTRNAAVTLKTNGTPAANLSNIKWWWWDNLAQACTDSGTAGSTNGAGLLTVTLPNSAKTSGQTGTLAVSTSDGTVNQDPSPRAFFGPVQVS